MAKNIGSVVQAVGPIIDVEFANQHLPELLTALTIDLGNDKKLTIEVAQHIERGIPQQQPFIVADKNH